MGATSTMDGQTGVKIEHRGARGGTMGVMGLIGAKVWWYWGAGTTVYSCRAILAWPVDGTKVRKDGSGMASEVGLPLALTRHRPKVPEIA